MRAPFKKRHRRFPLTRFTAYLQAHEYAASTIHIYLGAIRRMLAAVDSDWRSWDRVLAHFRVIHRVGQRQLMAAWTPWIFFAGAPEMPRFGVPDADVGEVGEAIRALLTSERGLRFFPRAIDLAYAVWRRREDDDSLEVELHDRVLHLGPRLQPCLDIILRWGWRGRLPPDRGSLFPDKNGKPRVTEDSDRPKFYRLRNAPCTPEFAEELQKRMQEAVAAAAAQLDSQGA